MKIKPWVKKRGGGDERERKECVGKEQGNEFVFEFLSITRYSGRRVVRRGCSFELYDRYDTWMKNREFSKP